MQTKGVFPNSERVPSAIRKEIQPILRVAYAFHRTHPRIAYLCVFAALEESQRLDPFEIGTGVPQFWLSLIIWLKQNAELMGDDTSDPLLPVESYRFPDTRRFFPRDMQSLCLDYYEKNIKAIAPSSPNSSVSVDSYHRLIYTCKNGHVFFKVLELLCEDMQLPPQILEAHAEVKRLVQICKPYNLFPRGPYTENFPIFSVCPIFKFFR